MKHARASYNGRIADLLSPEIRSRLEAAIPLLLAHGNPVTEDEQPAENEYDTAAEGLRELLGGFDSPFNYDEHATPIAEDEPVFLLRAQDMTAAPTVEHWAALNIDLVGSEELIRTAREHAALMRAWPVQKKAD
jgi:hypothetical protein